jgi:hypothetical protein
MSQLSDTEARRSARRSARNGILFGAFFVALGGVVMIVARGHLWAPLGRFRPGPQVVISSLMRTTGLVLVTMSIVNLVALRRSPHERAVDSEGPTAR